MTNETSESRVDEFNENHSNDAKDKEDSSMSVEELVYGASSFYAIVKPVSLTMLLSSLAVIYINTEESKAMGEEALGIYQAFDISEDQSTATSLGLSLVNALIIVTVIGAMTFLIVILYRFRCMKCLMGYMVLATAVLLMFLGGNLFTVAINKYQLTIDKISYWFTMYNFAVVGTLAIFYQKGIPTVVNQGYLIANSTIVAWQLSNFNDWMAWSLLIMLALYDLFAVLSPCGPLKALVNLMSKSDAPAMPGLLYEAELPANAIRPGRKPKSDNTDRNNATTAAAESSNQNSGSNDIERNTERLVDVDKASVEAIDADSGDTDDNKNNESTALHREENIEVAASSALNHTTPTMSHSIQPSAADIVAGKERPSKIGNTARTDSNMSSQSSQDEAQDTTVVISTVDTLVSATIPLAIARVYKLPITLSSAATDASIDTSHPTAYLGQELRSNQLQMIVNVTFPQGGGRIETTQNKKKENRYLVYDRHGELKRTLLVNDKGKVMEQVQRESDSTEEKNNIKLGLGDFIFYSVLVSKAAENGFAAFVSCFLSILTGLGGTLVLLAVYHHALPALPISIFLGVVFYLLTIYCMEPWIHDMWQAPYYV